jgi:hypothetical protein
MDPRILALMAKQHGLVTRAQMMRLGLEEHTIRRLVASVDLMSVRRGVYMRPEHWAKLDEFRGRPLAHARAAHYAMTVAHVMSHDSAALELGLAILRADPQLIHVTRPGVLGSRTEHGVKHHKAVFHQSQQLLVGDIPVLEPARTAVDIAREHGFQSGVVACDSALRSGVTPAQLERALQPMRNWPGVTSARSAVAFSDARAESAAESLGRILVSELGIGPVEPQFELVIEGRLFRCDLRVGRHIFEVDGRIKYTSVGSGGVATKAMEQVLWEEKQRQTVVCGIGLGMSRIVWDDYWGLRRDRCKDRLRREYAVTEARFGTSLDGLHDFLPRRGVA